MPNAPRDVAQVRLDNALRLFDEFVAATVRHPDAATLRGLERRFAERLEIQPSYWSQIKSRSRQIGERLARQFERLCHKPHFWMDEPHGPSAAPLRNSATTPSHTALGTGMASPATAAAPTAPDSAPQDDDERFIVGLVLTYYRRHPHKARTRLLDLLGEVLTPAPPNAPPPPAVTPSRRAPAAPPTAGATSAPAPSPAQPAGTELWQQVAAGAAPLKPRR